MIKNKDTEYLFGQTKENIKGNGKMGNNMEKENLHQPMDLSLKVYGKIQKFNNDCKLNFHFQYLLMIQST